MKNAIKVRKRRRFVCCVVLALCMAVCGGEGSAIAVSTGTSFIDTRDVYSASVTAEFVETRDGTSVASSAFTETIDTATPICTLIFIR